MFEEDWGTFFSDFAKDAALNGVSGRVMIDEPDTTVQGGMLIVSERSLVWPAKQWSEAKEKDIVTVGARKYRITQPPQAEADGNLIRAPVKEV